MSGNDLPSIVGTDGIVPVYEPNARWCMWSIDEIYTGAAAFSKYVPKKKDYVIDPETFTTYIVNAIDPMTLIPVLEQIRPVNMSYSFSETDILFGVGPGTQSDTYRLYVDTSVVPTVIDVENRLKIGGTMVDHVKIFLGTDCSATGTVVSRVYDASGNFVTNNVGLELIAIDSHVNYSIKKVNTCYTNLTLKDGEIVTVVAYAADGRVVSKRQLLVENTAFIRQANDGQRYVTSIGLESPFLSSSQTAVIEFPLNVPVDAMNIIGVVNYSDGSRSKFPVDGTKFSLLGIDQFVSTIVGQKLDLVLSYALGPTEAVYGAVTSDNKYVTAAYKIETVDPNNSYTVKVYGYPEWVDANNGYVMRWFMFNLDRNVFFDVTSYVTFATNTGAFNPKGYGYVQRKAIQLNLRDVSGAFKPYVHTQMIDITLNGTPNPGTTPWLIADAASSSDIPFGTNLVAKVLSSSGNWSGNSGTPGQSVLISSNYSAFNDWLQNVFTQTYPLADILSNIDVPVPTHFTVMFSGRELTYSIDQWNQLLDIGVDIPVGSTIYIRFTKQTATSELEISVAAMMVLETI